MKALTRRELLAGGVTLGVAAILAACTPASPVETAARVTEAAPAEATRAAAEAPQATPQPSATPSADGAAGIAAATATEERVPTTAPSPTPAEAAYLAVVRGDDPEAITLRALAAIGGIERFVRSGYDVIVKPNICNANHGPEFASTTNPQVVATLVRLCLGAGAKRVRVMDNPFAGTAQQAYARSGIEEAVNAAGGEMEVMARMGFVDTPIPDGRDIQSWPIYTPVLEADLVINVPIVKHHNLARLTLGGKNLMGVIEERGQIHRNLGPRIADIASLVRPQLTVVDAVRMLMANGPTGGNLDDVKLTNTVIASHDLVAADTYATTLFGLQPTDISYIQAASDAGLGSMDLAGLKIAELD
ncbi:MAG: DUF362 domain-containing protein [Anaerolineae bacterium]